MIHCEGNNLITIKLTFEYDDNIYIEMDFIRKGEGFFFLSRKIFFFKCLLRLTDQWSVLSSGQGLSYLDNDH